VAVPYKGAAPGLTDLVAGRLSVGFNSALGVMPHIKAGRLRVLAVTVPARVPSMPDVPTVAESGVPGFEASTWYGVVAPADTPGSVVQRLSTEFARALNTEEVKSGLTAQGLDVVGSTPEQFADYIRTEMVKWAKVVKASGMKVE
ncbi:MAG: tripartite tricarboxylate transporter substrate binding protein, partial [Burkholderiales bacterium]|nr:tripartite tricarboxylate transporter substrate binding protein [Burkholderiales bacterium]